MKPTDRDTLLALFRLAGDGPADSAHVADDDELLTTWRLGTLTPAEEDRFFSHLAACTTCRKSIIELADLLPAERPVTVVAAHTPPSRRRRLLWTAAVAVAACLVIGLAWVLNSSSDAKEVARARRDLNAGRVNEALVRLNGIRPDQLRTDAERAAFRKLQEEATFQAALADLKAGRFEEAAAHCRAARARGVDSPRLTKLCQIATADPADRSPNWEQDLQRESNTPKP